MISGVDEAGRGPVIGPLVVAGVTFKDESELIKYNIRDSKKITPNRRKSLAEWIKQNAVNYEIIVVPASDIDDMRKVMTINEIEVNLFSKVIEKLKPEECYVDAADVKDNRFGMQIKNRLSIKTNIISKHKADNIYPIVGAASILAKTKRDNEIERISINLEKKINLPLGSGYPADPTTKKFLIRWIEVYKKPPPDTRVSWKTVQNIIKEINTKSLDDY